MMCTRDVLKIVENEMKNKVKKSNLFVDLFVCNFMLHRRLHCSCGFVLKSGQTQTIETPLL